MDDALSEMERKQNENLSTALTSSIQTLQKVTRHVHIVDWTRTSAKCKEITNARAKRAKLLFFIVRYANL